LIGGCYFKQNSLPNFLIDLPHNKKTPHQSGGVFFVSRYLKSLKLF